ncbi:phosphoribosyltransferase [Phenylobacterium terrae]|uniref:Phosphoribosyltransferase n=1 Tax=Phenylobacterium terrae TaxID=2665495 RepID=A0ABW4N397_9CAUL
MINRDPIFADRRDAGRKLAQALRDEVFDDPIVLALPRGGVPVAFEVAEEFAAPLDLLFVRKIGAPHHPELGLGALVDGADPQVVLTQSVMQMVSPPPGYVDQEVRRQLQEIDRRRQAYLGGRQALPVRGRTVLLIDDGVATGGTVRAALRGLESAGVGRLVLGVPVGPADVVASLKSEADQVVCLATPEPFYAVGLWYRDFDQTSDEEVVDLLAQAAGRREPRGLGQRPAEHRP